MERLTDTEHRVLQYIGTFHAWRGYAPTYREIGAALGIPSTQTVWKTVKALVGKGRLRQQGRRMAPVPPTEFGGREEQDA